MLSQRIFKEWGLYFQPIWFLIFSERGRSERNNRKQNTVTLSARSGDELKSRGSGRINGDPVHAGFELELAGAERYAGSEKPKSIRATTY